MKKIHFLLILMVVMLFSANSDTAAVTEDFLVIVNPGSPYSVVSKSKVSHILLKKTSKWDNDTPAAPVDLDSRSPIRESFSRDVHGRSVANIKSYWQRQIFSGKSVPPPEMSSDADVIRYVSNNPGAIGYVSVNAETTGVKVVTLSN